MQRIYSIVILSIIFLASCSKSEDDGPSNSFVTKDQSFELSNGFISADLPGKYQIILSNDVYDSLDIVPGSHGISLMFRSPEDSVLLSGEYIYSDQETLPNRGFQGMIYLHDSAFFEIDSGKVVINNQGSTWNLDMQLRYNNIQSLSGIYSGTLADLDSIQLWD